MVNFWIVWAIVSCPSGWRGMVPVSKGTHIYERVLLQKNMNLEAIKYKIPVLLNANASYPAEQCFLQEVLIEKDTCNDPIHKENTR